ncbi:MAG: septum site-determining protein MinD [Thermococcaceae archaeon]|nr:septum site-determining protein MinD [Thermococcaceae archaeon]MDK2913503.1 septum site-determining protein MinD [Thermococcaceae archaeon]
MALIGVTGPGGSGKTTIALNLGANLALDGIEVVVVDANLVFPDLAVYLGVNPKFSLHQYLNDRNMDVEWLLMKHRHIKDLYVVLGDPSKGIDRSYNINSLYPLLNNLKRRFKAVLIDLPPGLLPKNLFYLSLVDYQLFVVDPARAPLPKLETWIHSLLVKSLESGIEEIGLVFNKIPMDCRPMRKIIKGLSKKIEGSGFSVFGEIPLSNLIHHATTSGLTVIEVMGHKNPFVNVSRRIEREVLSGHPKPLKYLRPLQSPVVG